MPTLPTSTELIASLAGTAQPWFNSLLPYIYFAGGLALAFGVAAFVIVFLVQIVQGLIHKP